MWCLERLENIFIQKLIKYKALFKVVCILASILCKGTPRPRAALLMCLKKYSAIGSSPIGNYVVGYSKLTLETVLLKVS